MTRFVRLHLQSRDPGAARAFYSNVFGPDFWAADATVGELPERAAAMGAPQHWLGHIGVADVATTVDRFVARGAQRLGPPRPGPDGATVVPLRDPFGAVLAVTSEATTPREGRVRWHTLAVTVPEDALAAYADLFGWAPTEIRDFGAQGVHHGFAWERGAPSVGSVSNLAQKPGVHTQWLYFFAVDDLAAAAEKVRDAGGLALEPMRRHDGSLVAACDDAQGGAFGLFAASGR